MLLCIRGSVRLRSLLCYCALAVTECHSYEYYYSGLSDFVQDFCRGAYNYTLIVGSDSSGIEHLLAIPNCALRIYLWDQPLRKLTRPIDDFSSAYKVIVFNLGFETLREIISLQYSPLKRQVDFICLTHSNSIDFRADQVPFASQIPAKCCQTLSISSGDASENLEQYSSYEILISENARMKFFMPETDFDTACLECGFVRRNDAGAYVYFPSVNGLTIHVGFINCSPYFVVQKDDATGVLREHKGSEIQMLRSFSQTFNFTYKLDPEPEQLYGSWLERNGSLDWVGLVGWVYHKKKDFVLSELGMTLQRLRAVTFSWPYIIDLITYAHPAPHRIESYAAMLWPFNELTWIAVVLCLSISSVIIQFFGGPVTSHGAPPGFWLLLALLAKQSNDGFREFTRLSYRLFIVTYMMYGFWITNFYCSCLFSLLSMPVFEPEVNTLDKLYTAIRRKRFRCGTQVSTSMYDVLQTYQHKTAELIKEQMIKYPWLLTENQEESIQDITRRKYCFISTRTFLRASVIEAGLESSVRVPDDYFYTYMAGTALQKKCHLIDLFNRRIHVLLAFGLSGKWLADSLREKNIGKVGSETFAISNTVFMGPYILLGGGVGLSVLTFIAEKLVAKKHRGTFLKKSRRGRVWRFRVRELHGAPRPCSETSRKIHSRTSDFDVSPGLQPSEASNPERSPIRADSYLSVQ